MMAKQNIADGTIPLQLLLFSGNLTALVKRDGLPIACSCQSVNALSYKILFLTPVYGA